MSRRREMLGHFVTSRRGGASRVVAENGEFITLEDGTEMHRSRARRLFGEDLDRAKRAATAAHIEREQAGMEAAAARGLTGKEASAAGMAAAVFAGLRKR